MPRSGLAAGMALLLLGWGAAGRGGEGAGQAAAGEEQDKDQKKKARLVEPWPDARKLEERQIAAEKLPLFSTAEPLPFTLTADFDAVNKDRVIDSPQRFPAVLTVAGRSGAPVAMPVRLGSRGNLRLDKEVCDFVPLRVEFPKKEARGTPFEGQGSLKLVTHCRDSRENEQYVLRESLAYKIFNVLSPASFRIRTARVTYLESGKGKEITTRWAFFIEDQDDLARRLQGRIAPFEKRLFDQLDRESLLRMTIFQALIGNTDYSIYALHNVRLVLDHEGVLRPFAYDFDGSGLVDSGYAAPDPRLRIASVRDRLYRGPCLAPPLMEPALDEFRARKPEILALFDAEVALTGKDPKAVIFDRFARPPTGVSPPGVVGSVKNYLAAFFKILDTPKRTKMLVTDRCRNATGM